MSTFDLVLLSLLLCALFGQSSGATLPLGPWVLNVRKHFNGTLASSATSVDGRAGMPEAIVGERRGARKAEELKANAEKNDEQKKSEKTEAVEPKTIQLGKDEETKTIVNDTIPSSIMGIVQKKANILVMKEEKGGESEGKASSTVVASSMGTVLDSVTPIAGTSPPLPNTVSSTTTTNNEFVKSTVDGQQKEEHKTDAEEEIHGQGGVIDPWKDDVDVLGLVEEEEEEIGNAKTNNTQQQQLVVTEGEEKKNTTISSNNSMEKEANEQEEHEGGNDDVLTRRIISFRIFFPLRSSEEAFCANDLQQHVPQMLTMSPPFVAFDMSCLNNGGCSKSEFQQHQQSVENLAEKFEPTLFSNEDNSATTGFWLQLWNNARFCRLHILSEYGEIVEQQPNCRMIIGFVDHLLPSSVPKSSLIALMDGPKFEGHNAVVRLVCANETDGFAAAAKELLEKKKQQQQVLCSEEQFLKTVFALEFTWHPDCIAVFFDTRTLNISDKKNGMAKLLLGDNKKVKIGTSDGNNKWAASKFVCGTQNRALFSTELNRMRVRNKDVPKELDEGQEKIRKVLTRKIDEEIFIVYEVTPAPPSGILARIWESLFG